MPIIWGWNISGSFPEPSFNGLVLLSGCEQKIRSENLKPAQTKGDLIMVLKALITPVGLVILVVVIAGYAALMIYSRKQRNKLFDEGKMIRREPKFWDKSETFTVSNLSLEEVYSNIPAQLMKAHVGAYELQNDNNRIVFVHNGYEESYTASLRLLSNEGGNYTYKFLINQYKYKNKPNDVSLNVLFTAVEKVFLNHDPNVQVLTETVDRKTKKSLF